MMAHSGEVRTSDPVVIQRSTTASKSKCCELFFIVGWNETTLERNGVADKNVSQPSDASRFCGAVFSQNKRE